MDINFKPQGFSNKETDWVALCLEDNSMDLGFWENEAVDILEKYGDKKEAIQELAGGLKQCFEADVDEFVHPFFNGLMHLSLAKVNWQEIAETLVEQAEVKDEY